MKCERHCGYVACWLVTTADGVEIAICAHHYDIEGWNKGNPDPPPEPITPSYQHEGVEGGSQVGFHGIDQFRRDLVFKPKGKRFAWQYTQQAVDILIMLLKENENWTGVAEDLKIAPELLTSAIQRYRKRGFELPNPNEMEREPEALRKIRAGRRTPPPDPTSRETDRPPEGDLDERPGMPAEESEEEAEPTGVELEISFTERREVCGVLVWIAVDITRGGECLKLAFEPETDEGREALERLRSTFHHANEFLSKRLEGIT